METQAKIIMEYVPHNGDEYYVTASKVKEALEAAGFEVRQLRFSGSCVGTVDGLSEKVGEYPTVRYGQLTRFRAAKARPGDTIPGVGVVVFNSIARDSSGWRPTRHTLLYVPMGGDE